MISRDVSRPSQTWSTKAEGAYTVLLESILNATIPPGATIDHRTFASELGISATPLREALRRLESDGYIQQVAHHQMRVASLSAEELESLYDVRILLAPIASILSVRNATDMDRARVSARAEFATDGRPLREVLADVSAFYSSIYQGCGNPVLIEILQSLNDRATRYGMHLMQMGEPLLLHKRVARAFAEGQETLLGELVESNLRRSKQLLADLFRSRSL